ncbi:MAG: extracellular solute-binding protein [Patescibacteria group bacterium]
MDEPNTNPLSGSGVVPQATVAPPAPAATSETFVVPAQPVPAESPFIPQGVSNPPSVSRPSMLPRRILMFSVFAFLLIGLIVLGRFVFGLVSGASAVTLSYWGLWENDAIIRPIIADFEASHSKIKVTYVKQSHRQYRERVQAAIARGEGPDVFRFHNTWVPMLRDELSSVPAKIMSTAQFSQTFYPVASADLVGGQTIYGLPLMIDGLGLYYNEDLFAAAGASVPATWEDVLNVVPKLTVKNGSSIATSAIALGTTGNVEHASDILATMMMQNGVNLREPTGTPAEEALIFYRKFADPVDPVYTWNETLDNSVYAFAMGKVAMMLAPSWRAFEVKQINPALRFKIAPIPQLPGNTVTWASYWVEGVNAKSKYQKQAWEFVAYLTGKQAASKLYTEAAKTRLFGEPYGRVDMTSGVAEDPYVGAFIKQAPNAKSFPLASRTFDNGINDKLITYLLDAVNGVAQGSAPSAALQTAAAGFRQVLGSYGLSSSAAPPR